MDATFSRPTMPRMPRARLLRAYLAEARSECLRYLRNPGFMLPTLLFPGVFYLMFAVVLPHGGDPDVPRYLLASYVSFGVMAPGLFGFGMSLALERDNGLLTLKRALPMPPAAYLLGKMTMALGMAAVVVTVLVALAVGVGHVGLSAGQALRLAVVAVCGSLPFCALGLLVGTFLKGQAAPAVINVIYLPMAFLSGLWVPMAMLPKVLQRLAPVWPSWHLDQLALAALGFDTGTGWPHVLVLAGFTAAATALAARRLRRNG